MRDFIHRFGSSQNGHVHFDVGLDDWVAVDHWTSRKRVVVAVWLRCPAVNWASAASVSNVDWRPPTVRQLHGEPTG